MDSSSTRTLQSLSIMCRASAVVNSITLQNITSGLSSLTSFTLIGCTKLNDDDVLRALKSCGQLKHLAIEAVSIKPGFYRKAAPFLSHLESLRTSHPDRRNHQSQSAEEYYQGLTELVQSCPNFNSFTHYLSGGTERGFYPSISPAFVLALVKSCGNRLVRFEISGLSIPFDSVRNLCLMAKHLQQLVLPISIGDIVRSNNCLTARGLLMRTSDKIQDDLQFLLLNLRSLRSLHIVAPGTLALKISLDLLLEIAMHCSSTLKQIGFQNRFVLLLSDSIRL